MQEKRIRKLRTKHPKCLIHYKTFLCTIKIKMKIKPKWTCVILKIQLIKCAKGVQNTLKLKQHINTLLIQLCLKNVPTFLVCAFNFWENFSHQPNGYQQKEKIIKIKTNRPKKKELHIHFFEEWSWRDTCCVRFKLL